MICLKRLLRPRRALAALLAVMLLSLSAPALASNFFIFPDSDRRELTREEVWQWQYEALGYAFNEMFARYGRPFEPGSKYDNYFHCQTWYREDPNYPKHPNGAPHDGNSPLSALEWRNEHLIKEVREEMRALGTTNPGGKPLPPYFDDRIATPLTGFEEVYLKPDQRLKVYDGPGAQYRRGAGGKAMASTNGRVYAAGWESGWLMLMYQLNDGGVRVGFASPKDFKDQLSVPQLQFARTHASVLLASTLVEDPVMTLRPLGQVPAGSPLLWLNRYSTPQNTWDYVELTLGGELVRGFLPAGVVNMGFYEDGGE